MATDAKSVMLKTFYETTRLSANAAEHAIFNDCLVSDALFCPADTDDALQDRLLADKLDRLRAVRLGDLISDGPSDSPSIADIDEPQLTRLSQLYIQMLERKTPAGKLAQLRELCAQSSVATEGADALLPRLTFVLIQIQASALHATIRFIHRFSHPALVTGESVFVMTSLVCQCERDGVCVGVDIHLCVVGSGNGSD